MKLLIFLILFFVVALLLISASAHTFHDTRITIISPKANAVFKDGQMVDIHFKLNCEEMLQSIEYSITNQDEKILFGRSISITKKRDWEEKFAWKIPSNKPAVLTLSIKATDVDGHSSSKIVQFNANF